jgi:hypothetical protein
MFTESNCGEGLRLAADFKEAVSTFRGAKQSGGDIDTRIPEVFSAWNAFEDHMRTHECLRVFRSPQDVLAWPEDPRYFRQTPEFILVADDARQYMYASESATRSLGLDATAIMCAQIEDLFSSAWGEAIPESWRGFVSYGLQIGICRTVPGLGGRKFAYRAMANVAPGIHVSILRELMP